MGVNGEIKKGEGDDRKQAISILVLQRIKSEMKVKKEVTSGNPS